SYRWRSEPQIAVEVTRRIASCGLTISGSGTVSTRTSWRPCQVSARIGYSSDCRFGWSFGPTPGRTGIGRDLAGLDQLLEPAQIAARLHVRLALHDLRDSAAWQAAGRGI